MFQHVLLRCGIAAVWVASLGCPYDASERASSGEAVEPLEARSICGFSHPESVVRDGERFFVSNIGEAFDGTAADGDGFISELGSRGEILELRAFAPRSPDQRPLHAPKGMAVVGGTLFVADLDRVVGFDIESRERVFEAVAHTESPPLLNDLAVLDHHTLLVSDTLNSTVLEVNLEDATLKPIAHDVLGANGIAIDHKHDRAYVVGLGADFGGGGLYALDLRKRDGARAIDGPFGIFDGIALLSNGRLITSDWVAIDEPLPGTLITFTTAGTRSRTLPVEHEMHGPADFYYDRASQLLWVPLSLDNCVRIIGPIVGP